MQGVVDEEKFNTMEANMEAIMASIGWLTQTMIKSKCVQILPTEGTQLDPSSSVEPIPEAIEKIMQKFVAPTVELPTPIADLPTPNTEIQTETVEIAPTSTENHSSLVRKLFSPPVTSQDTNPGNQITNADFQSPKNLKIVTPHYVPPVSYVFLKF